MRIRRRRDGDWDDPEDITLQEVVEDHDAELAEHGQAIGRHDAEISDLKTRMDLNESGQAALIDEAAERARRERDHVVAYDQKLRAGEVAGKGPYRCSHCSEYGHNRRGCPDRVDA